MPHVKGGEQSPNNKSKDSSTVQTVDRLPSLRRDLTGVKPIRSITQIKSIRRNNSK
ncbi:MAG: hypothetical protein HN353_04085 [Bdellovibrionales bacterium]|jgi:hypothetical protein|nr:hypothetical protein [Bdellovibrionales bacterium]MBT3526538.1 hypothetical protein [Bdellovibrionales bacterium]MBT7669486.1 hypothetical protein [Bdellovibrionales bacterium]MBT7767557.1 hypothetical protein [Bdellovibrionales bacterium]